VGNDEKLVSGKFLMFGFYSWFGYDITCFAGESAPQQAAMRRVVREIFDVV
jgi:hypothetical protein